MVFDAYMQIGEVPANYKAVGDGYVIRTNKRIGVVRY